LIRHTFSDDPAWELIRDDVPLGALYEVHGFDRRISVTNVELQRRRTDVPCYLVQRLDAPSAGRGWIPCDVFEAV
jgi:hypothetical protein